jgi:plasmid stability protein
MATLTLKNVPEQLYAHLKRSAERNRRSLNREAIVCLEQALRAEAAEPADLLARARELRARAGAVYVTADELREARDAGRA